jgi:hypothetical protein
MRFALLGPLMMADGVRDRVVLGPRQRKGYVGKRPRTWLSLTPPGREAFDAHVAALQHVVAKAGATLKPTTLGQS